MNGSIHSSKKNSIRYLCHVYLYLNPIRITYTNDINTISIISNLFSLSVPASFLTMGTAVVGAGTLITCSWEYLPSAMSFVLIIDTSGQVDYIFDLEMGDNRGLELLSNAVGWMGDEMFFVYINKTEKRQVATYNCIVGTADDMYLSNAFEFNVKGKNILHCCVLLRRYLT